MPRRDQYFRLVLFEYFEAIPRIDSVADPFDERLVLEPGRITVSESLAK